MNRLDAVILQQARLQIMASLAALPPGEQLDFVHLRTILELTNGNLGAHLAKLEAAGYVRTEKTFVARRPRTYIALTDAGRDVFHAHVEALKEIIKAAAGGAS